MSERAPLPASLEPFVQSIGSPVEAADIDLYSRYQAAVDRSHRIRTLVNAWERQQIQDRTLRKKYARWLMWAMSLEILIAVGAFFLIGFGRMNVPTWVASVFFGSVFSEVTGLALFVVKYLFPQNEPAISSILRDV